MRSGSVGAKSIRLRTRGEVLWQHAASLCPFSVPLRGRAFYRLYAIVFIWVGTTSLLLKVGLLVIPVVNHLQHHVSMYHLSIFSCKISIKGTSYSSIHIKIYMMNFTWHSELRMMNHFMLQCKFPLTSALKSPGLSVSVYGRGYRQFVLVSWMSSSTLAGEAKESIGVVFQSPSCLSLALFSFLLKCESRLLQLSM